MPATEDPFRCTVGKVGPWPATDVVLRRRVVVVTPIVVPAASVVDVAPASVVVGPGKEPKVVVVSYVVLVSPGNEVDVAGAVVEVGYVVVAVGSDVVVS